MRIAMLTVALAETILAVTFGVEWLRDRRRPPGRRTFGRPYKLAVVLAAMLAVACFAVAFTLND